jgi:uncharacterized membrane protein YjdF
MWMVNIGILLHLSGFFGAYSLSWGFFQWDNNVHILNGAFAAWIMFNFIAKTFGKKTYNNHKLALFLTAFAIAVTLGAFIELTEFTGAVYLGHGEGLFFVGSGDTDGNAIYGDYYDTMDDQVSNVIGALIGTFVFYKIRYSKKK